MKPHSPSSETPQRRSIGRQYRQSTKKYFNVRYPEYVVYGLGDDGVTDESGDLKGNNRKHGVSTAKRSRCSPLAESDPIDVAVLKKPRERLKTTPVTRKSLPKNPVVTLKRLGDELIDCLNQSGFVSASQAMLVMGLTPCVTQAQTKVSEKHSFHSKEVCEYSRSVNHSKPLLGFGSLKLNQRDLSCESSNDEKRLEIELHDLSPTGKMNEGVIMLSAIPPYNTTTKPNDRRCKQSLAKSRSRSQSVEKTDDAIEILENDQEADAAGLLHNHSCHLPVFQLVPGHTVSEFSKSRRAVEGFRNQYYDTISVSSSREPSSSSDSENELRTNLMAQSSIINEVDEDLDSISPEPQDIRVIQGKVKQPTSIIESGDGCCRPEETKLDEFSSGSYLKLGVSSKKQRPRCPGINTSCPMFHPSNQAENGSTEEKLSFCSGESALCSKTSFSAKNPMPPSDSDCEEHQPQISCEGAVEEIGHSCKTAPIEHLLASQEGCYQQNPCSEMNDIPKTVSEKLPVHVPSNKGDEPLELLTNPVECVVNPSELSSSEVPSSLNDFSLHREEPVGLSAVSLEMETTSESVCDVALNEEMNEISSDISVILEEFTTLDSSPTASGRKNARTPLNTSDVSDHYLPPVEKPIKPHIGNGISPIQNPSLATSWVTSSDTLCPNESSVEGHGKYIDGGSALGQHVPTTEEAFNIDENLIATNDPVINEAGCQMTKSSFYRLPLTKITNGDQIQPRSPQLYANESNFDDLSRASTYESSSDNKCTTNQVIDLNENVNDKKSRDCGSTSPVKESTGPDESPKLAESQAVSPAATVGNVDLIGGVVCQCPLKNEFWHELKHNRSSISPAITRRCDKMNNDIGFDKLTQPSSVEITQRCSFLRLLLEEISHITPTETAERSNEECCISNELCDLSISKCTLSVRQQQEGGEPILRDRPSSENGFHPPLCNSNENPTLETKGISCDSPYQLRNDDEAFHCSVENDSSSRKISNSVQVPLCCNIWGSCNIWGKHLTAEYVNKKTPLVTQVINEALVKDCHSNSMEIKVGGTLANIVNIDNHLNQVEFRDNKNSCDVANCSFLENTFFLGDSYQDLIKKCSQETCVTLTPPAEFLEMSDYTEALDDACLRTNLPESSNGYLPSVHVVESADFPSLPHTGELPVETAWGSEQRTEATGVGVSEEFGTECSDPPRSPTTCNPADLDNQNVSRSPNVTPNSSELIVDGVFNSTDVIYLPPKGLLNDVLSQRGSKSKKLPSSQLNDVNSTTNTDRFTEEVALLSAIQREDVIPSSELIQPSSSQRIATELSEGPADNISGRKVNDLLFDEEFELSINVTPTKRTRVKKTISPVPTGVVTSGSSELVFDEEFELSNNTPVKKIKVGPSVTVSLLPRVSNDLLFDEEFERSNNVTPVKNAIRGKRQLREPSPSVQVTSCGLVNDLVIDENDKPPLNATEISVSDNEYPSSTNIDGGCVVISSDEEPETPCTNNNPTLNNKSPPKMVNRPAVRSLFKPATTMVNGTITEKTKGSSTISSTIIVVKTSNPPLKQIGAVDRTLDEISHIGLRDSESVHSLPRLYIKAPVSTEGKVADGLELKTNSLKEGQEAKHCKQELSETPSKSILGLVTPIESGKVIPNDSNSQNKPKPPCISIKTTAVTQNSKCVIDLIDSDSEPSEFNVDPTCSILYSDSDLSVGYNDDLFENDDSFISKNNDLAESCSSPKKALTTKSLSTHRQNSVETYSHQLVKLAETIPQRKRSDERTSSKAQDMQNSKLVASVREQSPESLSDRDFMDSDDSLWSSDEDTTPSIERLSSIPTIKSTKQFTPTTLLKSKFPKNPILTSNHNKIDYFFSSDEDDMLNRLMPPKKSQVVAKRTSRVVAKSTVVSKNSTTSRTAAPPKKGTPPSFNVKSLLNDRKNRGLKKPTRTSSVPLPSKCVLVPSRKLTSNRLTKSSVNSAAIYKRSQNDTLPSTSSLAKVQHVQGDGGIKSVSSSSSLPGSSKEHQKISRKRAPTNLLAKPCKPISKHPPIPPASRVEGPTSSTDDGIRSDDDWDLTSSSDDDHRSIKDRDTSIPGFLVSKLALSRQSMNFIKNMTGRQSKVKVK